MRYSVLAAVAAATVAAPAFAQVSEPFNGVRVEAIAGYDSVDVAGEDTSGIVYGAGIGFDFSAGGAVLGLEAEYTDSAAKECFDDFGSAGARLCTEVGRDIYVGARAGARVASNSLLYVKAGYTNARLETSFSSGTIGAGVDRRFELDGYRLGAGAEFALSPSSFVNAEHRFSHYAGQERFRGRHCRQSCPPARREPPQASGGRRPRLALLTDRSEAVVRSG